MPLPWLVEVPGRTSLRARLLDACLRRSLKRETARLDTVTPAIVHATRRRMARLEPRVAASMPRAAVVNVDAGGVEAEQVTAAGASPGRALLLVHGGAYAVGTPALYRGLAARLSRAASCTVLVPAYRLAPEHPFPAACEDVRRAWDWLAARWPREHSAVAGDSAGGGLALGLLAGLRDAGLPGPAAGIGLAPWTDLTCSGDSLSANAESDAYLVGRLAPAMARLYLGAADARDPRGSPLLGTQDGLPPLLLQVSKSEILLDDTMRFARAAHAAGGTVRVERWRAMPHVFQMFAPLLPEAGDAIARIGAYLHGVWRGSPAPGSAPSTGNR